MKELQTNASRLFAAGVLASLLTTAVTTAQQYPAAVLANSPVGYWRLNETGTVQPAAPASNIGSLGSAANGAYIEANKGLPGIPGSSGNTAAGFPGLVDENRVRIPWQAAWNQTNAFSVEFWAKPGQTATSVSPGASTTFTSTTRSGWLFYQGDSTLNTGNGWYFRLYRSATGTANRSIFVNMALNIDQWYHVVGVFDTTNLHLYVNGAEAASPLALADTYRAVTDTTAPMTFGNRSDGATVVGGWFPYVGDVDEPAFYTYALSGSQVSTHYQAGTNAATPNYSAVILADTPAGYWRLGEAADLVASNVGSIGASADANYVYNAQPGSPGPTPSSSPTPFAGFEAANKAASFDGANGTQISIPALFLDTNTVTMAAWINPKGAQPKDAGIVFSRAGTTTSGLKISNIAGLELGYDWNNSAENFVTFLNIPDSQWSFVALTVDPNQAIVFLHDGTTFQMVTNVGINLNQTFEGKTLIGQYTGATTNANFNGQIDEVSIFDHTLSVGDVYSLYSAAIGTNPPVVFNNPVAPSPIYATESLTLSVDAGGTPPLSYQWRKNGNPIGGNTNTFSIPSLVTPGDSGNYDVVITNPYGSAPSQIAAVNVSPLSAIAISQDPVGRSVYVGGSVTLTTIASGGALHYQWSHAGTNIPGATSATYTITSATVADDGAYTVTVANALPSSQTSGPATVTVVVPTPGTYPAAVVADAPEAYWRLDETSGTVMTDGMGRHDGTYNGVTLGVPGVVTTGGPNLAGSFPGTGGSSGFARVPYSPLLNQVTYSVEAWVKTPDSATSQAALSSISVNSSSSPYQGRGYALESSAFSDALWYAAYGRNNQYVSTVVSIGPVAANQWTHLVMSFDLTTGQVFYYNGIRVPPSGGYADFTRNSTADFLIGAELPGLGVESYFDGQVDEVAYYPTALSQAQVQAHYQAALYGSTAAPRFTLQPESQAVAVGSFVGFTATAEGSTPISLQWLKNGVPIPSETTDTLILDSATYSDSGNYQLRASNSVNTVTSAVAVLTVWPSPPAFANLTNGLVLHLKFDDNLLDASGRGNNGTSVGATTFVSGVLGNALNYSTDVANSLYNYVTLGVRPDLQFGSTVDFTVAYWVRLPSGYVAGDLPIFCNDANSLGGPGYTFAPGYGSGNWALSLGAVRIGDYQLINDGQWHHLVHVVQRAGNVSTYLDGVLSDISYGGGQFDLNTGQPTNIGQDNTGAYAESGSADLDDLGVWRRALTEYEAESIYQVASLGKSFDSYGPVTMAIQPAGSALEIIWAGGTLLQSTNIAAPPASWTPVPGATAPYFKVTPGPVPTFYRARL